MSPGRNEICSCGSGRKYKKCCGQASAPAAAAASAAARATAVKALDHSIDKQLLEFARSRGGPLWMKQAAEAYLGSDTAKLDDVELQLAIPWMLYHYAASADAGSMAGLMRELRANRLSPDMRSLLDAQLEAWLSVWEVQEVEPGVGVALLDLLTGAARFVHEVRGSQGLVARHALLGRVVSCNGISFLAGLHPRALAPQDADPVVREMRRLCRVRTRPVAMDTLQDPGRQLQMIDLWRLAVHEADRPKPLPVLHNTDGDLLVLATDHFDFDPAHRSEIMDRLSAIPGAEAPVRENGEIEITVTKPGNAKMKSWDNTVIGRFVIRDSRLKAEANSTRRADSLRRSIETALGSLVRHRLRDQASSAQLLAGSPSAPMHGRMVKNMAVPPALKAAARQMKEDHMLGWADDEIPALGGRTPRQAAKSPASRAKLELLLRDIEHREALLPADERFDVRLLRASLGLHAGLPSVPRLTLAESSERDGHP